jgi:CRISPR-associated exonuclease Cas4
MSDTATDSTDADREDLLEVLISAVEHFSYCPRQCALIHVEQTYDENLYTIRGSLAHERVDSGASAASRGVETTRALPLWSERYGLRGKADVVEWHDGVPFPVEYKVGRRHGEHADVQLCAQALCLEEMFGVPVPRGAIFYGALRRRHELLFDAELRERTQRLVAGVRSILAAQSVPPAVDDQRCPNCSLINACLPAVMGRPGVLRAHQQALYTPLTYRDGT